MVRAAVIRKAERRRKEHGLIDSGHAASHQFVDIRIERPPSSDSLLLSPRPSRSEQLLKRRREHHRHVVVPQMLPLPASSSLDACKGERVGVQLCV